MVAAPEQDALREASYFVERLERDGMPLAGLVLNRVHSSPAARLSAARSLAAAEALQGLPDSDSSALAITALRLHAERMHQAASERRLAQRFTAAHPLVPVAQVPAQPDDVHDLDGLRVIGAAFAGDAGAIGAAGTCAPPWPPS